MKVVPARTSVICVTVCLSFAGAFLPLNQARGMPAAHMVGKKKDSGEDDKRDSTKPPFKGMTKAQALKAYGEPDSVGHRDGEELWTYVLNRGTSFAKSFIPFGVDSKLRYRLLTFKGGKVIKYRWDAPDKED